MLGLPQLALDGAEGAQIDAVASIGVLSRFDDPDLIRFLLVLFYKQLVLLVFR
jgi:hypothetical protein